MPNGVLTRIPGASRSQRQSQLLWPQRSSSVTLGQRVTSRVKKVQTSGIWVSFTVTEATARVAGAAAKKGQRAEACRSVAASRYAHELGAGPKRERMVSGVFARRRSAARRQLRAAQQGFGVWHWQAA